MSKNNSTTCTECGEHSGVYPTRIDGEPVEYCEPCMLAVLNEELAGMEA